MALKSSPTTSTKMKMVSSKAQNSVSLNFGLMMAMPKPKKASYKSSPSTASSKSLSPDLATYNPPPSASRLNAPIMQDC